MATPNTPKLRFNEFLEQKIEYRSGGKGQWKHMKKVWEGLKLKWTQEGHLGGGPPSAVQLKTMECGLKETLQEAREKETEKNKIQVFKKEGSDTKGARLMRILIEGKLWAFKLVLFSVVQMPE